jgi:hypothetical protein
MFDKTKKPMRPLVISDVEAKRAEAERLLALAGAAEHPIFQAVLGYADEHARNEHEMALQPNLTNEQRQFNAGRSAAAYDFALALRQIQANAEANARKLKKQE